ncbi:hypothetical protein [Devosia ginsengisoli]|uniref:hypothetical protein n=1 Tax=Devosia ginsengisoli TaxID=400770 RepID=UPI0026F16C73|nr:hypothetical protein [Devosia ginsengisoli]MCR6670812.1 hypothetical protein [Devosia ginsengisoli]
MAKPGRDIGERAVEGLFDEIEHKPEHRRIFMPCRLIERGSLADLSAQNPQRVSGAGRV